MRRVSSRQRLVSWDAFDAAAHSSDGEDTDDFQTCYVSSHGSSVATAVTVEADEALPLVGRKRERPRFGKKKKKRSSSNKTKTACFALMKRDVSLANLVEAPVAIPALAWEFGPGHFSGINQDVQLHVLSFLDVADARAFSAVDRASRQLVVGTDARWLWRGWYERQWPMLYTMSNHNHNNLLLVDSSHMPTAGKTCFADKVNLSALLGMAAKHQPQVVDKATTVPQILASLRRVRPDPTKVVFRTLKNTDGTKALQFVGKVGTGDRCLRSDQPLSRPRFCRVLGDKASLFKKILCRNSSDKVTALPPWRPFVSPFVTTNDDKTQIIDLTPRLVSYYEVSILQRPDNNNEDDDDDDDDSISGSAPRDNDASDCVAVGLAPRQFHVHSRMPGWDSTSYAYHGDDGGIFHGAGVMERRFGPAFGEGDTVGCGVDYVHGGIFFTLNGKFLGYGWTHVDAEYLQQDLFPTVGVDTNWPVQCNYGERPFEFDFCDMVKRQQSLVRQCIASGQCTKDRRRRSSSLL